MAAAAERAVQVAVPVAVAVAVAVRQFLWQEALSPLLMAAQEGGQHRLDTPATAQQMSGEQHSLSMQVSRLLSM